MDRQQKKGKSEFLEYYRRDVYRLIMFKNALTRTRLWIRHQLSTVTGWELKKLLVSLNSEINVIFPIAFLSLKCHLIKYYHGSSLTKCLVYLSTRLT